MQRYIALLLAIIFFIVFMLLAYYGARITTWSSIIFGLFIAFILLNIFYPPGQVAIDDADVTLFVYAIFEIISIFLLAIYIAQKSLSDVRTETQTTLYCLS